MNQPEGRCPSCDHDGKVGEACPEKACAKRGYHYIPKVFWDRVHRDSENPDPMIGALAGDFLIVDPIGAGGFGKVFLALQSPLFRLRGALKLIEFPSDNAVLVQALAEKFQGEAEALAELTHPNIVRLLKYGMHGKKPYLVMEYVDNAATLRDEIYVRAKRNTGFTHEQLKSVFDQILNGLEAAHAQNIIHRDVKPENVMLQAVVGNPMHVKLLDFGTAKFIENRADTKWPLGSPSYMAPEQVNLKGIGPWSDLYAVGVMIFELLTGHRPFPGKTENEIVSYKMNESFDPFVSIEKLEFPDVVMAFLRKALQRLPEDRFRSVEELRGKMHEAFDALSERPGAFGAQGPELTDLLDSGDLMDIARLAVEQPTRQATQPPAGIVATDEKSEPPSFSGMLHGSDATSHNEPTKAQAVAGEAASSVEPQGTSQKDASEPSGANKSEAREPSAPAPAAPANKIRSMGFIAVIVVLSILGFYWMNQGARPKPLPPPNPPVAIEPTTPTEPDVAIVDSGPDIVEDFVFKAEPTRKLQGVSAGKFHTCAIVVGKLRCWGANFEGELGLGNSEPIGDDEPANAAPYIDLPGVVTQVAAAGDRQSNYTCALLESGEVHCWGANQFGQLGLGHTDRIGDDETPGKIPAVSLGAKATFITAGASQFASHACAVLESGKLRCWGGNKYGELGLSHTTTVGDDELPSAMPPVGLSESIVSASAGKYHTCTVGKSGAVRCWGWNKYGQLGLGHTNNIGDDELPSLSKDVDLGGPALQVSVGRWHSCALLKDHTVHCWGRNNTGQLGLGHTNNIGDDEVPSKAKMVDLGGEVSSIAVGSLHTCAMLTDGKVRCWGDNKFGQLGYSHTRAVGDDEIPSTVADVYLGEKAVALTSGAYHNCVVLASDTLKCWGYNKFGQLGYGHTNTIGDTETPASSGNVPVFDKE